MTMEVDVHRHKETDKVQIKPKGYLLLGFSIAEFRLPIETGIKDSLGLFVVALGVRKRRSEGRSLY